MELNYDYAIQEWYGKTQRPIAPTYQEELEEIDIKTGKTSERHLERCSGCSLCEGDINR